MLKIKTIVKCRQSTQYYLLSIKCTKIPKNNGHVGLPLLNSLSNLVDIPMNKKMPTLFSISTFLPNQGLHLDFQ
jgi:hypothetical protein